MLHLLMAMLHSPVGTKSGATLAVMTAIISVIQHYDEIGVANIISSFCLSLPL